MRRREFVGLVGGAAAWPLTARAQHGGKIPRVGFMSTGHTAAIDRLTNGEVTAAVLALVSADAADGFPEIAGFKIFRVPLWPPALKARP